MARKKKAAPPDELEALDQSWSSLTGRKPESKSRPLRGLGFLCLVILALALGIWYLSQYF